ncbi:MAG: RsmD family RNA methyltransferase, partial [Deltaproteobacteria bacterium]|nr:RsmD family RNA methyltransferase [Deltaproteobacteria bacterium]
SDRGAVAVIRQNVETCRATIEVLAAEVRAALRRLAGSTFDVIFADPPYAESDAADLADLAGVEDLLAPDGVFVLEHRGSARDVPLAGLEIFDRRRYGDSGLTLYRSPESARKG